MILNLSQIFTKYNISSKGVIHVGAHFGEESDTYLNLGIKNVIYFEPVKKTFEVLKSRCKNNELLFNFALGNSDCIMEMFVEDSDQLGCHSLLQPSDNYKHIPFSDKQLVEVKKLDSLNLDFFNYDMMNIDVQGFELEVLKGSENTLKNINYIQCEVSRNISSKPMDYIEAPDISEIIKFLSERGFSMVECNWAGISWGDAFFIKDKFYA